MKHGTFNQKDKEEFNAMMGRHDQLIKHQDKQRALKAIENKKAEEPADTSARSNGSGSGMDFIADFKKQNKEAAQEEDDETWLNTTVLDRDDKVRVNNLSSQGFYIDTLRGLKVIPWLSFSWWLQINKFSYAQTSFDIKIDMLRMNVEDEKTKQLAAQAEYLHEQSGLHWKVVNPKHIFIALAYALLYPLHVRELKQELRDLSRSKSSKGWFWQKLMISKKIKVTQRLLEDVIATETRLVEAPPTQYMIDWLDGLIGEHQLSIQTKDIIKNINLYFTSKKKVEILQ